MGNEQGQAMSDQDKSNNGNLVPAGRRDLAPVASANPLVLRGLADLAKSQAILLNLKNALFFNNRGIAWLDKRDYDEAAKDFNEAIRLDSNYAAELSIGERTLRLPFDPECPDNFFLI